MLRWRCYESLNLSIPVVGLVKDEKHRTAFLLDGRDMEGSI